MSEQFVPLGSNQPLPPRYPEAEFAVAADCRPRTQWEQFCQSLAGLFLLRLESERCRSLVGGNCCYERVRSLTPRPRPPDAAVLPASRSCRCGSVNTCAKDQPGGARRG